MCIRSLRQIIVKNHLQINLYKLTTQNVPNTEPRKHFHSAIIHSEARKERLMPTVYYYQNPLHWLKIKWKLMKLKRWDKEFNEEDFKRGTRQAISSVTNIVSAEHFDDLNNLLTPFALMKLRRDVLVHWNDDMIRNVNVGLSDIKLAVPTRVHFPQIPLHPQVCDIDMWYMAMKWRDYDILLIMDFVARFNRNFTNNHNSEWTISFFELRKYHLKHYDDNRNE